MATIILTNWTIYYADEVGAGTGYKQIKWTGGTGTNTLNELYSEIMHVFDNSDQNNADDSIPLKAVTPTLYEVGSFDAGDKEPWFIDPVSIEHLTGGGLNTVDWTYVSGSEAGIFKIPLSSLGTIVDGDVGAGVTTSAGSMTGTLLHVDTVNTEIYVRPTNSSATHDWSTVSSGTITCNAHTCTQNAAGATGENIYANIYSIGSIVSNTEIYVTQSDTLLTQWWDTGHIDILVLVSQQGSLIDNGLLRVFSRQYATLYDHFETTVATGGRNPIPLATADDVNNDTGYRNMTFSGATDTYTVGEKITGGTSTAQGIVTAVAGSPTTDLDYYLIGTVATDFQTSEVINGASSGSNESSVALSDIGPKATTPATITATFEGAQFDLGNGYGNAWYSVSIDCKGESISSVYERLKYITRRGYTATIDSEAIPQTILGEQYQGIGELYIPYDSGSVDNPFTKGEIITGPSSFTGTLTAKHDRGASEGFLVIRDYSGTVPVDGNTLTGVTSTHTALVDDNASADPVTTISPNKQSPFGSFAGGKFFGARGVYIHSMHADDASNYSLIDSENNTQDPPTQISISVNRLTSGDKAAVFRANTDGSVDKEYLPSHATSNGTASTSWVTDGTAIPNDTPSSGTIRLRDTSAGIEEKIAYSSWTGTTFTLDASHSGGYDGTDFAYVPYIDDTASGSSLSQSVTYAADRTVLARVRIVGYIPFSVTGTLDIDGYSVDAIKSTDDISS